RLELVRGDEIVEIADLRDQRIRLGIADARLLEVRAHAAAQRCRLADVDDLTLPVLVEIDSGTIGHLVELFWDCHGQPDSARTSNTITIARGTSSVHRSACSTRRAGGVRDSPLRPGMGGLKNASTLPRA